MAAETPELSLLRAQVQELADKQAIRELTARYNQTFDDDDPEGYAGCWTEDGRMVHENGDNHGGPEEFIQTCRRYAGQVVHTTMDPIIEIDGDTATQVCSFVVYIRSSDRSKNEFFMSGRYRDELARTPAGWRFRRRRPERDVRSRTLAETLGI